MPPSSEHTYCEWSKLLQQEMAESSSRECDDAFRREWFWLLDACTHAALPKILWELETEPDAWPLYMNTFMEDAMNAGPWLVPCSNTSNVTRWVFQHLESIPLGCLVSANCGEGTALFEHFQNVFECIFFVDSKGVSREKPGIFRFYDPRILYGVATFHDPATLQLIKGTARSLHAWEPGRKIPITRRYNVNERTMCTEPPVISRDMVDHLWLTNQIHTVIGTLGNEAGQKLREKPLPEAYEHLAAIAAVLEKSKYTSSEDLGFAVAYFMSLQLDDWKSALQLIIERHPHCDSLSVAAAAFQAEIVH